MISSPLAIHGQPSPYKGGQAHGTRVAAVPSEILTLSFTQARYNRNPSRRAAASTSSLQNASVNSNSHHHTGDLWCFGALVHAVLRDWRRVGLCIKTR
jgi:hypothetical protein